MTKKRCLQSESKWLRTKHRWIRVAIRVSLMRQILRTFIRIWNEAEIARNQYSNTVGIWIPSMLIFKRYCYETILSGRVTHCKAAAKAGVLCFTSFTFCNNNISCSLRLNERIYNRIHSSVFYSLELAVMINLHKYGSVWFSNGSDWPQTFYYVYI